MFARAIAKRQPEATITLIDRPAVISYLRDAGNKRTNGQQVDLVCGDYTELDLNQQYDLVLLSNILHNEDDETLQRILRGCYTALLSTSDLDVRFFAG